MSHSSAREARSGFGRSVISSKSSKPALIDRFVDLSRPERRLKHFGQFGPFVIEEEFHT